MMRASSVAVWFAPATILVLQFSPMGLALAVSATRLLWAPSRTQAVETVPWVATVLSETEAPIDLLSRHWVPALLAPAGFQVACIFLWMGRPLPAAALFTILGHPPILQLATFFGA